ncbi:hypothetical protein V8B55DRAFT_1472916 [Mucor lusitanicus]|uniref:Ubinuclein middle domain-containing protein n=1 Tax=Mucor circinelloides f. lusitanicus TaxID=29924 RepID=A0A8H4F2N0_MUCCL|nr:hypothetical protein FB192DRAFT_1374035 [Mucor lusitanicus]
MTIESTDTAMEIDSTTNSSNATDNLSTTAAVAATTAAATADAAASTTATATVSALIVSKLPSELTPTIRIHVDTTDLPRPVIVNYRQLYKRELKKLQDREPVKAAAPPPNSALDSADDIFYRELLKKAEAYNVDDDDVDDDGSDDENIGNESRKRGEDYDFDDPFIDDSDMLMDEPIDHNPPEYDGFFVWHGPLDGHEVSHAEKKQSSGSGATSASKRKTPAKSKASSSAATGAKKESGSGASGSTGADKSRKKTVVSIEDSSDDKKKLSSNAATSSSPSAAASTVSKTKKPSTTVTAPANSIVKKASTTPDKASKKRAKLEHNLSKDEPTHKSTANTVPPTTGSGDGAAAQSSALTTGDKAKKKSGGVPATLKPLDPEIEVLMEKLRHDVKNEDFSNKAKFPAALKPTVLEAGLITLRKHRIIDENLVYHLMQILPYNKFTLRKFLTTKSGQMRVDELQQEIDELAIKLKQTIDRMMPEQQRLFNEKLAQAQASSEPSNPDEEPTPKFKCNDEVRKILYDIIQTEEQSIHIANQVAIHKDAEKKTENLASDGKARKLMYQRLLSCWPEGWINSYEMSRQYSQYKSKVTAMSEKKSASASLPSTPKANISTVESKKRKRPTPTTSTTSSTNSNVGNAYSSSSSNAEALRKKRKYI